MNKLQKINSADKGILRQWLQGVFSVLYDWNAGPVYGTDISLSVVDIRRKLPFPIDLSPEISRGVTSEVQQALYNFESASQLIFIQREIFKILVSERSLKHRYLRNKVKIVREFYI